MNASVETAYPIDPVFQLVRGARLVPWDDMDVAWAWRHLSSSVARDPLDLESHTRRILLALRLTDGDRLMAALVDLFLAVGPRGMGLRRRLLDLAAPQLESEDALFLRDHLASGLPVGTPLPPGCPSVLDVSLLGRRDMVGHHREVQASAQGPLAQAVEMLDLGDVDGARALLESAILESPDDEAMAQELQTIYRHSRDEAGRAGLVGQLESRWGRVPAVWQ
jgi:hypothetical protein